MSFDTAKAFICKAQLQKSQRLWATYCRDRDPFYDHISQIFSEPGTWPILFYGSGHKRVILSRLRFGHIPLNCYLYRFGMHDGECDMCDCGASETRYHFLLVCPAFDRHRSALLSTVRNVAKGNNIDEILLLGGCRQLPFSAQCVIADAVYDFVIATRRFSS